MVSFFITKIDIWVETNEKCMHFTRPKIITLTKFNFCSFEVQILRNLSSSENLKIVRTSQNFRRFFVPPSPPKKKSKIFSTPDTFFFAPRKIYENFLYKKISKIDTWFMLLFYAKPLKYDTIILTMKLFFRTPQNFWKFFIQKLSKGIVKFD